MALSKVGSIGTFSDFAVTLTTAWNVGTSDCLTCLGGGDRSGGGTTVSSITWNAQSFTLQTGFTGPSSQPGRFGHIVGSFSGSQNLVLTMSTTNTKPMLIAVSFAGVDQGSPVSNFGNNSTTSTSTSFTITSATGDYAVGIALYGTAGLTFTASDTETSLQTSNFAGVGGAACFREDGAASITVSWTHANSALWGTGYSLKAAGGGGGGATLAARRPLLGVGL